MCDGSALSETVLPVAADWAHEFKVSLRLVHALQPGARYTQTSGSPDLSDSGYQANLAQRAVGTLRSSRSSTVTRPKRSRHTRLRTPSSSP